jgi:hypothetical protein
VLEFAVAPRDVRAGRREFRAESCGSGGITSKAFILGCESDGVCLSGRECVGRDVEVLFVLVVGGEDVGGSGPEVGDFQASCAVGFGDLAFDMRALFGVDGLVVLAFEREGRNGSSCFFERGSGRGGVT